MPDTFRRRSLRRPPVRAILAVGALAATCTLLLAPSSHSAEGLAGVYIVVDGPQAGVQVQARDDGLAESESDPSSSQFDYRGFIRNPAQGCGSLHFKGRIERHRSGNACWRVVQFPRASRLLLEMRDALVSEERARNVNNQKALDSLHFAGRSLNEAFDRLEKAERAGRIPDGKFKHLENLFVDVRRIDDAAEAALKRNDRQEARRKLVRALDLKHEIVDRAPRELLVVQPPDLKPMLANFVPAQSQTVYTQRATNPDGRDLRFHWTLVEHNDPTCINFEPNEPREHQAIWHHADNQGCSHHLEGPNGHVGTIAVVVRDGKFECAAFYSGSNDGAGPQPPRCQPLD